MWHYWTSARAFFFGHSEGSRRGQVYHGAVGDKSANRVEKRINAGTESEGACNATYQIAAVTKTLNLVSTIVCRSNTLFRE